MGTAGQLLLLQLGSRANRAAAATSAAASPCMSTQPRYTPPCSPYSRTRSRPCQRAAPGSASGGRAGPGPASCCKHGHMCMAHVQLRLAGSHNEATQWCR